MIHLLTKLLHTHRWKFIDSVNIRLDAYTVRHYTVLYCEKCGKVEFQENENFPSDY